jgi:hypothetical protein
MAGVHKILIATTLLALVTTGALASGSDVGGGMGGGMGGMDGGMRNPMPSNNMPDNIGDDHDPVQEYQAGVHAMRAHQYARAVRHLREAQRGLRSDPNINFALGLAYVGNNDPSHARETLERTEHLRNPPLGVHLELGLVYLQLNQHDRAVAEQTALQTMLTACDATCGEAQHAQIQSHLDALTQAINAPTSQ